MLTPSSLVLTIVLRTLLFIVLRNATCKKILDMQLSNTGLVRFRGALQTWVRESELPEEEKAEVLRVLSETPHRQRNLQTLTATEAYSMACQLQRLLVACEGLRV